LDALTTQTALTALTAQPVWQVRLLGAVQAQSADRSVLHWPSRAACLLLARLALQPTRNHPREELVELLWPGVDLAVGRNRLRQTLSTLKSLLTAEGEAAGAVLVADRQSLRVAPGAVGCDAVGLERALREGRWAEARAWLQGSSSAEFMPGFYEDWVQDHRQQLDALVEHMPAPGPVFDAQRVPMAPDRTPYGSTPPASGPKPRGPVGAHEPEVRLPRYLTTLFGAAQALQQLLQRVRQHRWVTLVGPGGAGKTRLAVEAAGQCASTVPSQAGVGFARVLFVSLVPCQTQANVVAALASVLQLPTPMVAVPQRLAQALGGAPSLLLLDNCEQLHADALAPVAALLGPCPGLQVLATSRRPLALDGETVFEVLPLQLPHDPMAPPPNPTGANQRPVQQSPAVALFIDRARAVRADFRPSQAQALAALVRVLDGLPLAIELAASRIRTFSPKAMLELLTQGQTGQRLDLLQRHGLHSGVDQRHASMRRVVQWSWQLLQPEHQAAMQALSVFVAPFKLESAQALAGAASGQALDELVAHSMVTRVPVGGPDAEAAPRFMVSGPVLEFVREVEGPRSVPMFVQSRNHLRNWLLSWAQGLHASTPLAQMQHELTELRALLRTAAADQACVLTLRIALALRPWWDGDGWTEADLAAVEALLQQWPQGDDQATASGGAQNGPNADRADVHELLAYLHFGAGHTGPARQHAQAALHWAGEAPAPRARALLRQVWIELASYQAQPQHGAVLQEALTLAQASGDRPTQARVLHQMAIIAAQGGKDWEQVDTLLHSAQQLWLAVGDHAKASARQRSRAELLHRQCRWGEALLVYDETEARAHRDGDWVGLMDSALLRGLALAGQRRWADAAKALARCAWLAHQRHHAHGLAYALWHQSRVLARLRRPEAAARLMGFASHYWQTHIGPLTALALAFERRVQALVAAQTSAAQARVWLAAGTLMALDDALALATHNDTAPDQAGHGPA
jgi:predicted ATPase